MGARTTRGNKTPKERKDFIVERGDRMGNRSGPQQQSDVQRQQMAEQIAREQQAKARAEAEYRLAQQQAQAASQSGASTPDFKVSTRFIQSNRPIEGPIRNEKGMPIFNNRPGRQTSDQDARRRELDQAARARQEQMIAFEREMSAAKEAEERLRKNAATARTTRGNEGDARLAEETQRQKQQEALFEAQLREAEAQYRAQARQPGRRVTPESERQAQMISEFERARKQAPGAGRDQAITAFEQRFQGQEAQPGAGITVNEGGPSILSYQELLKRLKQYQGGMA
jgi:hypothetical protein